MKTLLAVMVLFVVATTDSLGKHTVARSVFDRISVEISSVGIPDDPEGYDAFVSKVTLTAWDHKVLTGVTTEDWKEAYEIAATRLCGLAGNLKLDSAGLRKCLEATLKETGQKAVFPVAVYWCPKRDGGGGIWVVAFIWEMTGFKNKDGKEEFWRMNHIRACGFDSTTFAMVGFFTCD